MKKLFSLLLLLYFTAASANQKENQQDKKQEVYTEIQQKLNEGEISPEEAQAEWIDKTYPDYIVYSFDCGSYYIIDYLL